MSHKLSIFHRKAHRRDRIEFWVIAGPLVIAVRSSGQFRFPYGTDPDVARIGETLADALNDSVDWRRLL